MTTQTVGGWQAVTHVVHDVGMMVVKVAHTCGISQQGWAIHGVGSRRGAMKGGKEGESKELLRL